MAVGADFFRPVSDSVVAFRSTRNRFFPTVRTAVANSLHHFTQDAYDVVFHLIVRCSYGDALFMSVRCVALRGRDRRVASFKDIFSRFDSSCAAHCDRPMRDRTWLNAMQIAGGCDGKRKVNFLQKNPCFFKIKSTCSPFARRRARDDSLSPRDFFRPSPSF